MNKTGTSSLKLLLSDLGFRIGNQREAESEFGRWVLRDFRRLADFCGTADAFQDVPLSLPFTFVYLDQIFLDSRFILTERDPNDWYDSFVRFHEKVRERVPSLVGDIHRAVKHVFGTSDDNLYERESLINCYLAHNDMVKTYFRDRPRDLLILNVASKRAVASLCNFLGTKAPYDVFPHVTSDEILEGLANLDSQRAPTSGP